MSKVLCAALLSTPSLKLLNRTYQKINSQESKSTDCDLQVIETVGHILSIIALFLCETISRKSTWTYPCFIYIVRNVLGLAGLSVNFCLIFISSNPEFDGLHSSSVNHATAGLGVLNWLCCLVVLNISSLRVGLMFWSVIGFISQAPRCWMLLAVEIDGETPTVRSFAYICLAILRLGIFATLIISPCPAKPVRQPLLQSCEAAGIGSRREHENLSTLSQITFDWIVPVITISRQRSLMQSDIFALPSYADPCVVSEEFWQVLTSASKRSRRKSSGAEERGKLSDAVRVLWAPVLTQLCSLRLVCDALSLSSAVVLQLLLERVANDESENVVSKLRAVSFVYAVAILVFMSTGSLMSAQLCFSLGLEEQRVFAGLSTALLRTVVLYVPEHVAAPHRAAIADAMDHARTVAASLPAVVDLICLPLLAAAALGLLFRLLKVSCPLRAGAGPALRP